MGLSLLQNLFDSFININARNANSDWPYLQSMLKQETDLFVNFYINPFSNWVLILFVPTILHCQFAILDNYNRVRVKFTTVDSDNIVIAYS